MQHRLGDALPATLGLDNPVQLSILLPVRNEAKSLKLMVLILEATIEVPFEILVIYDSLEDDSIEVAQDLRRRFSNLRPIYNDLGQGVQNAVKKGASEAQGEVILITVVDEVFPIAAIMDMLQKMDNGCDFVSCTRYALGGRRLGGSLIGGILSRVANKLFRTIGGSVLSDATTGVKMMKKSILDQITFESRPVGWSFALEMSIKAQLLGATIGEVPVVSVDRPFGGESTFRVGAWVKEYLRWFMWGVKKLRWENWTRRTRIRVS